MTCDPLQRLVVLTRKLRTRETLLLAERYQGVGDSQGRLRETRRLTKALRQGRIDALSATVIASWPSRDSRYEAAPFVAVLAGWYESSP